MVDRLDTQRRSWLMSRVRGTDTGPELVVRTTLHKLGYRYRLYARDLPGKPDLVFPGRKRIVFVHGCFWHAHDCKLGRAQSKSNLFFWQQKMKANVARDSRNSQELRDLGWSIHTVWECEVKADTWLMDTIAFLEA